MAISRHILSALAGFSLLQCLLFITGPAFAEKRVALIIGNGAYKNVNRLPNPKNDAEDIAAALKRTGFETIVGLDLDKAGMESTTIRFARAAREADVAVFYYSGHAMQFAGINYLMPVDAKLTDEADLRLMSKVDDIVADLQQAKNLRILVLDSCRDNPLAEELKRSIGRTRAAGIQRGLAKIDSPQGMIVAYATQAGRTADDGTGRNSPYTAAFLRHIEAEEEIGTVFRRISADVYDATKRSQLPELSLSLIGEFYLKGRPANTATAPAKSTEIAALQERLRTMEEQLKKKEAANVAAVTPQVAPATPPSLLNQATAGKQPLNTLTGKYELKILETKFPDKTIHAAIGTAHIASATGRCFVYIPVDVPGGRVYFYLTDYIKPDGSKEYSELNLVFQNIKIKTVSIMSGGRSFGMYIKDDAAWSSNAAEERDLLKSMAAGATTEILMDIATARNIRRSIDVNALQNAIASKSRFCRV
ncbi:MAG: caspase family protein [Rhizobiales bacterium]|nr:caspase family protein [Hyphomicrobiales bacterium]